MFFYVITERVFKSKSTKPAVSEPAQAELKLGGGE